MKTPLRLLVSVAAAAVLLAVLAYWGDVEPASVFETIRRLPLSTWLLALAVHCAVYAARALRFRVLLPREQRPRIPTMLAVAAAHNLASYVLPMRSGEATLVIYLKSAAGVPTESSVASLLVSRALDLATMAAALSVLTVYLSLGEHWSATPAAGLSAGALLLVLTFFFFAVSARGEWLTAVVDRLVRASGLAGTSPGRKLRELAGRLGAALVRARGGGRLSVSLALSLAMWGSIFLFYALLARGFGLPEHIGFPEAAFGSSMAVLTNVLPINSFAGFGTQETGWVLGFGLLGVDGDAAFATGVGVHLVQLGNVVLLGVLGHFGMGLLAQRSVGR